MWSSILTLHVFLHSEIEFILLFANYKNKILLRKGYIYIKKYINYLNIVSFISPIFHLRQAVILRWRIVKDSVTGVLSLAELYFHLGTTASKTPVCLEH